MTTYDLITPVLRTAVVIPCFNVKNHILQVIAEIGDSVSRIYVVDDCCPQGTGHEVEQRCADRRVRVIFNSVNLGVGGTVMVGYAAALADGMDIIVKVDGDGQMNPALIPAFTAPIETGEADYTKGNRFFNLEEISRMPGLRIFGNTVLSLMSKLSSGYWDLFDPTNGYTAIHSDVVRHLPMSKISPRYFFETDMLFRLGTLRAVVVDIPMSARYGDEVSNLRISAILGEFIGKHLRNMFKRLFYNYYLRDMSLASFELPIGILLLGFGTLFGAFHWALSLRTGVATSPGTVMLSALPVLVGIQFILAFVGYDIQSVPKRPIHLQKKFLAREL
ncbi:Family 2 glycosyl transferase [Pseudomonas cichorii]|uniref:Family 2 glycosyl transferase n=1 Tax=Pseudomonas cichorii TaxID=36746 RepID=A0A3M4M5Y8_PSECI|nr:glycosyltransferase family 2 protein [Pseudomonas cichorii]RMQ49110.1 Family 2 glycosyl transferase [Pseudomonas cichorii]